MFQDGSLDGSFIFYYILLRPRPHQQQCRSNRQHCRSNVRLCRSNMQHSTLLPQTATMSNDSIVKFRPFDNVKCCFDIVAFLATTLPVSSTMLNDISSFRVSTKSNVASTMLPVASTLLLVWTGPK